MKLGPFIVIMIFLLIFMNATQDRKLKFTEKTFRLEITGFLRLDVEGQLFVEEIFAVFVDRLQREVVVQGRREVRGVVLG